jgi:acetyl-CoA decarbonylase/synthase complex subunit gamma
MHYRVDPGLYALGLPDDASPVVVTANYKLSFDNLRAALRARNVWVLVLDTEGINVWCAAGKGTFGTGELVRRIEASGLARIVSHRRLIVPQLGAPGVAAHEVKALTGFEVRFGPVRAADLPAYLAAGCRATPAMRRKTFALGERLVLIPIELVAAAKWALFAACGFVLVSGLAGPQGFWHGALRHGLFAAQALFAAVAAGAVFVPVMLPWVPGRAFSLKGLWVGLGVSWWVVARGGFHWGLPGERLEALAWLLLVPAVTAYLALNFTGASTYTSLSGVKKEMRWAVPLCLACTLCGLGLWGAARWLG